MSHTHPFRNFSAFVLPVILATNLALAEHAGKRARVSETLKYPIYDVELVKENLSEPLPPENAEHLKMAPYRAIQPTPFYYRSDVRRTSEKAPFLVAGVNCDSTIAKTPTITGIEIEKLEKRARPAGFLTDKDANGPYGDLFWGAATNRGQRISTEGFLNADQSLRELLIKDNQQARTARLSHQDIASPLIAAMLEMQKRVLSNENISTGDEFEFHYPTGASKKTFKVSVTDMQDFEIDPRVHPDAYRKNYSASGNLNALMADFRKRTKRYTSGWVGWGVQGSPFEDDLFASCVLTFKAPDGETLTVDCLTPQLVHRYGFYQGGKYRVAPDKIVSFFNIPDSSSSKRLWDECLDTNSPTKR
jgi:hypothetical protein